MDFFSLMIFFSDLLQIRIFRIPAARGKASFAVCFSLVSGTMQTRKREWDWNMNLEGMTVGRFLSALGSEMAALEPKFPTWNALFGATTLHLRSLGLSIKARKQLLRAMEQYRCVFVSFKICFLSFAPMTGTDCDVFFL